MSTPGPRGELVSLLRAALLGAATFALLVHLAEARAGPAEPAASASSAAKDPGAAAREEEIRGLLKDGRYEEAARLAQAYLVSVEGASGAESIRTADALDLLVESLRKSGKGHEPASLVLARRAVSIREKLLGPRDLTLARSRQALANVLESSGDLAGARQLFEKVLEIRTASLGRHPDVASSLNSLGNVLLAQDDYAGAKQRYELALEIQRETLEPSDPAMARTLHRLGMLLTRTSDFAGARRRFEEALSIYGDGAAGKSETAGLLNSFATLLEQMGEIENAVSTYRRALEVRRLQFGPRHPQTAFVMNTLANALVGLGDYAEARRLLEEAIEIEKETLPAGHRSIGSAQWNLGRLFYLMGDYALARAAYEESMRIWQASGEGSSHVAELLLEMGALSEAIEEPTDAARFYERALEILRTTLGEERQHYASALNALARARSRSGDEGHARRLFEQALAIRERVLSPDHRDVAESLHDLANSLAASCEDEAALPLLQRALAIREKALGADHPLVARTLIDLAEVLARKGEISEAFDDALKAESISRNHLRLTARSLPERQALGYAAVRTRGIDLSLWLALEFQERIPDGSSRVMDALIRSRALVLDEMASRSSLPGGDSDPNVVRIARELEASRTRLANLAIRGPDPAHPESHAALLEEARRNVEAAERSLTDASVSFRETLAARQAGLTEVSDALPRSSAIAAFAVYERPAWSPRPPPAHAGEKAPDCRRESDSSVLSYASFVLRSGERKPELVPIGPTAAIDAALFRSRDLAGMETGGESSDLKQMEAAYRSEAALLRRQIWDPLLNSLASASRVFIVPDGNLSLANFGSLPIEESSYLLERGPRIHYLSTERDLVAFSSTSKAGKGLLALGGPDFDAMPAERAVPVPRAGASGAGNGTNLVSSKDVDVAAAPPRSRSAGCADFRTIRFEPLPDSALEVAEITASWARRDALAAADSTNGTFRGAAGVRDVIQLSGPDATESAFKDLAPGRRDLHISTHGFFLEGRCASALTGSRGVGGLAVEGGKLPPPSFGDNPLLLSGLALAGANRRGAATGASEDGILTAEEISGMDLQGVRTAVLSACETGVGRIRAGEGVLGLRRAFEIAGVRSLVMSLWSVDDAATREWMRRFYENRFTGGLGASDAAYEAALGLLRARRARGQSTHPYYWAGFVAAGDWR
jgi:tetratricopeptide (TPR) repeat protein